MEKEDRTGPNAWLARASVCGACGTRIVVIGHQGDETDRIAASMGATLNGADYWWYCANKACRNHVGECTYDMEQPVWIRDADVRGNLVAIDPKLVEEYRALLDAGATGSARNAACDLADAVLAAWEGRQ